MRTPWTLLLIPLLAAAAPAQRKLGGTYEDKKHGYALRTPEDWKMMPVKPGERLRVAIFRGDNEQDFGKGGTFTYETEMNVLIFPRSTGATEGQEGAARDGPRGNDPGDSGLDAMAAVTKVPGAGKPTVRRITVDDLETDEVTLTQSSERKFSAGGREQSYTFRTKHHAAVYHTGEADYVVHYSVSEKHYPKYASMISASIHSFRLIEKELEEADLSKLSPEEKQRYLAKRNLPLGWYAVDTHRYVLKSNSKDRQLVKDLGEKLERIRELYEEEFPSQTPIREICVLVVCGNREDYLKYDAPSGSAGYWSPGHKELVIYNDRTTDIRNTYATLFHEGFHQYIHYSVGEISPHDWFNEGHGDYFSGAAFSTAAMRAGKFEVSRFPWRVEIIRSAVRAGNHVPLGKFLKYTRSEYYGPQISQNYAQGWSLIYFLRKGHLAKEWRGILETYFETLKRVNAEELKKGTRKEEAAGKAREAALEEAFKGIDLDALEKAWIEFVKSV